MEAKGGDVPPAALKVLFALFGIFLFFLIFAGFCCTAGSSTYTAAFVEFPPLIRILDRIRVEWGSSICGTRQGGEGAI